MHFDFKVTTWERVVLNPKDSDKAIKAFEEGLITCADDLFSEEYPSAESELIEISSEQISPQENGGYSTVEVYNDEGECILDNSIRIGE